MMQYDSDSIYGIKASSWAVKRVLCKVNYMLTGIPTIQHKYFLPLLQKLNQFNATSSQTSQRDMVNLCETAELNKRKSNTEANERPKSLNFSRKSNQAKLKRITSAPAAFLHNGNSSKSSSGVTLNMLEPMEHLSNDDDWVKLEKGSVTNANLITEVIALTEFGLFNAALCKLKHLMNSRQPPENTTLFLVGKCSYKLGKHKDRPDVSGWYLNQSITCFQHVIDSQPHHVAARVYQIKAVNRLTVMKKKLYPLITAKYTEISFFWTHLPKLKASQSKFQKSVAAVWEFHQKDSAVKLPVPLENFTNFKMKTVPEKELCGSIWGRMKTAGELLTYQRYLPALDVLMRLLNCCSHHSLYHMKAMCLVGIKTHKQINMLPEAYGICSENIRDVIRTSWRTSCRFSRYRDCKVLLSFGRFLGTYDKLAEASGILDMALKSSNRFLKKAVYLELVKVQLKYDTVASAKTLHSFAQEFGPTAKQILSPLKKLNEHLNAQGKRGEAIYWNNKFVSMGVVSAEEVKKFAIPPLNIFQKFRKSSSDGSSTEFSSLLKGADFKGSHLLKMVTNEVGRSGVSKGASLFSNHSLFNAKH